MPCDLKYGTTSGELGILFLRLDVLDAGTWNLDPRLGKAIRTTIQ